MSYTRFAIYYLPPPGALARFGAAWLGWDVATGAEVTQPDVPGLDAITQTPRRYGFHGTLKPPFRLAEGCTQARLEAACAEVAATCAPARADRLALTPLGRFLALTPVGDAADIARVAGRVVRDLDAFRAPAPEAELARRRKAGLSARHEANLQTWGYPYVMEDFRFHLTLTGRLPKTEIASWTSLLRDRLPPLPAPFGMEAAALVGERPDGRFELIQRYTLTG